jgi:hypothetical protein
MWHLFWKNGITQLPFLIGFVCGVLAGYLHSWKAVSLVYIIAWFIATATQALIGRFLVNRPESAHSQHS